MAMKIIQKKKQGTKDASIHTLNRGFALLIAVIFMAVMLTLGLELSSLGYKQEVLASAGVESQYAFYAADSALECSLYADQKENSFAYNSYNQNNPPPTFSCDGVSSTVTKPACYNTSGCVKELILTESIVLGRGSRCADITIYKYASPQPPNNASTYIYSQGYDVPCTVINSPNGARYVSRGVYVDY